MGGNSPQQPGETKDMLSVFSFQSQLFGWECSAKRSAVHSEAFRDAFYAHCSIFCVTDSIPSQPLAVQQDEHIKFTQDPLDKVDDTMQLKCTIPKHYTIFFCRAESS